MQRGVAHSGWGLAAFSRPQQLLKMFVRFLKATIQICILPSLSNEAPAGPASLKDSTLQDLHIVPACIPRDRKHHHSQLLSLRMVCEEARITAESTPAHRLRPEHAPLLLSLLLAGWTRSQSWSPLFPQCLQSRYCPASPDCLSSLSRV